MGREQITNKEGICIITIFVMGSTMIIGSAGQAKNDAWIAGILGLALSIPMIAIYIRILSLFPGKGLYEILDATFGKVGGGIVSLIYIWYSFHLGALVIRNFGEFVNTATMPETPMLLPMLCLALTCIICVKLGIEVLGRVSAYFLPVMIFIILLVQLLGISFMKFNHLKPILANGIDLILSGAYSTFSFPYAETVLFLGVFFTLNGAKSIKKVYFSGVFIAGALIIMLTARNILVLGGILENLYFPSHVAVSTIGVGNFIERIEVTVALVFVLGVFVKTSVCLFVASRGIAKVFNLKDYKSIVLQTGLLMTYFSYIMYHNIMEMQFWAFSVYHHYAFPFQVIIPIILWIIAEVKVKKGKSQV